jgi:hypothetical protein
MKLGILNGFVENVLVSCLDCRSVIFHPLRDLWRERERERGGGGGGERERERERETEVHPTCFYTAYILFRQVYKTIFSVNVVNIK